MLAEVKESIINAYEIKTGLSRAKLSHLMDAETWMSAKKAIELGFADDLLFKNSDDGQPSKPFLAPAKSASRTSGITAFASALSTVGMVGIDRIHRLLQGVFRIPISTGTIRTMLNRLKDATDKAVTAIREQVKKLPLLHVDETGWRVAGSLHWLHCACDAEWSYFAVDKKRGSEAMDRIGILPEYTNLAIHDCWAPYGKYTKATHALCGAHILRELVYVEETFDQGWARELKSLLEEILHQRHEREASGATAFAPAQLEGFSSQYDALIVKGISENPLPDKCSSSFFIVRKVP